MKKKSSPLNYKKYLNITNAIILFLVALVIAFAVGFYRQANVISNYELIEKIDNQACRFLDNQPEVNGGFNYIPTANEGEPRLVYWCFNGQNTTDKIIHTKPISEYNFGATVQYFTTFEEASEYAENVLNPLRFWGVDFNSQKDNQSAEYIFIVTDEEELYFDSYIVKDTAILRVRLPCESNNPAVCDEQASAMLNRNLIGISVL